MKQDKTTFAHRNLVNLFIIHELGTCLMGLNTIFTLGGCLFGAVKLTKNADPDKYVYNGYGIGFGARSNFLINGEWGKNVVNFCVDNSLSVHANNKKKPSY